MSSKFKTSYLPALSVICCLFLLLLMDVQLLHAWMESPASALWIVGFVALTMVPPLVSMGIIAWILKWSEESPSLLALATAGGAAHIVTSPFFADNLGAHSFLVVGSVALTVVLLERTPRLGPALAGVGVVGWVALYFFLGRPEFHLASTFASGLTLLVALVMLLALGLLLATVARLILSRREGGNPFAFGTMVRAATTGLATLVPFVFLGLALTEPESWLYRGSLLACGVAFALALFFRVKSVRGSGGSMKIRSDAG